jgi:hypothetical protein
VHAVDGMSHRVPYPEHVRALLVGIAADVASVPPDLWTWFATSTSVDSLLTTGGGLTLAALFATNRILTRGQHLDRVGDLRKAHEREVTIMTQNHARELAEKDAAHTRERDSWDQRYAEQKEALANQTAATALERERADRATDSLGRVAEALETTTHVLESLDEVAKGATDESS